MVDGLQELMNFFFACFIIALLGIGYFIYSQLSKKKTFKSKEPPTITYQITTDGKTVDTLWIYKFK